MQRYFFHLHDELDVTDEEGASLSDDRAARAYAIDNVREVACESVLNGRLDLDHFIEVVREDGAAIFRVRFGEAIAVSGQA